MGMTGDMPACWTLVFDPPFLLYHSDVDGLVCWTLRLDPGFGTLHVAAVQTELD